MRLNSAILAEHDKIEPMRLGYGLLILSLTGLCGAVAIPAQQEEPKAETVFRNIVSFKGEKASSLIPAMQFMNASLKVGCDYCHAADRSSDEKGPKKSAREMIEMQRDINKKNFGGRNQVTCATCHGGHTHPVAFPPIEGLDVRARRSQDVKADDVLAAYGKAVGGDPAHPITALQLKGTTTIAGVKSPLEATVSGKRFVYTTPGNKEAPKQGYNGGTAWYATPTGIHQVPVQFATESLNGHAIYMGVDSLPKISNTSGATAKLAGKDNLVVNGTLEDKTRVTLFFDKTTNLLSRVAFYYPTILGSIAQINDYSDYRKVNGVQLPMTIAIHSAGGDALEQFRSVNANPKLEPTVFDPPKN